MTVERIDPPEQADERTSLAAFLDFHRSTLEWKCDGLNADQLRERPVPSSTMSLLGLVRHLADVERGWFQRTFAGDEDARPVYYSDSDPDGDFDNVDTADVDEAFANWRAACERSREIVAAAPSLEASAVGRQGITISLRWIMLHMLEEYARHNGHADLFREAIDGATGE
jgi:uncharacterized damage-inducible protein DinB